MAKRVDDSMLVRTKDMEDLIWQLCNRFTVGTHQACRLLKCSRTWFQSNVAPSLHYVYIGVNALPRVKAAKLGSDQCRYDAAEFDDFIFPRTAFERLGKAVILEAHVADPEALAARLKDAGLADDDIDGCEDGMRRYKMGLAQHALVVDALDERGKLLYERLKGARSGLEWKPATPDEAVAVMDMFQADGWRTVADMMDYGDAAETHYRQLFRDGAVRCSIEIPQGGGKATRHVMFAPDPEPESVPPELLGVSCSQITVHVDDYRAIMR